MNQVIKIFKVNTQIETGLVSRKVIKIQNQYYLTLGNVKVEDEEAGGNSRAATLVIQTDAEDIHDHEENVTEQTKCCPQFCYDKLPIFSSCDESDRCKNIRSTLRRIGQNFYYDAFVFIILIVGCISLVGYRLIVGQ